MRRHKKPQEEADLDITSFMNLMIVLVPVLLLNMVFAQTSVLDLKLPLGQQAPGLPNPEETTIDVNILEQGFLVKISVGQFSKVVGDIAKSKDGYNYAELNKVLKEVKKGFPTKKDINLLSMPKIDYQTLVFVMDSVRTFKTNLGVDQDLFPEVSLGDAPFTDAPANGAAPDATAGEAN